MNQAVREQPKFPWFAVLVTFCIGAGLEIAVASATGEREAWDSPAYAVIVLPGLALTAATFAWFLPRHSVVCGVAAVVGHLAAMTFRASEIGSMWPIGLLFSIPIAGAVALIGLFVGRLRREATRDDDGGEDEAEDE